MTLGGLLLESLPDDKRQELNLPAGKLALRAKHVGQYNDHAVAKKAGVLKDDVIVAIAGDDSPLTESHAMVKLLRSHRPGDEVAFRLRRGEKTIEAKLRQQ